MKLYLLVELFAIALLLQAENIQSECTKGFCSRSTNEYIVINTDSGKVVGNQIRVPEKVGYVQEFLGIPFAEPPVEELRFANPVPVKPWSFVLNATRYGPPCPASANEGYSEDCLQLNIWAPLQTDASKRRPVMFFLHGGSFNARSASEENNFNGTMLSSRTDVVVVTSQYRLGFFGFHDDFEKSGNAGLRDQVAALKWVRNNIDKFGGDPTLITAFGHSAGAISIGLLIISPESKGLFKRAILQSGSPYSFLRPDSLQVAARKTLKMAKYLQCSQKKDKVLDKIAIKCLRALHASQIVSYGAMEKAHSVILPNPIYGDEFLPANVAKLVKSSKPENSLDILIGTNNNEGDLFVSEQLFTAFNHLDQFKLTFKDADVFLRTLFKRKLDAKTLDEVVKYYLIDSLKTGSNNTYRNAVFRAYGDLYVYCPTYLFATALAANKRIGNVYGYLLRQKASIPAEPDCGGVCHGEEEPLIFGKPFSSDLYTPADQDLSDQIMNRWTSFSRTGYVNAVLKYYE